jgi:translation initiation factor RLI1
MSTWFATTTIEAIWASFGALAATPPTEAIRAAVNKSLSGVISVSNLKFRNSALHTMLSTVAGLAVIREQR